MQEVVNVEALPETVNKVSRDALGALRVALAAHGKELVSVQILCKDREKELIYAQEFGFEGKEDIE